MLARDMYKTVSGIISGYERRKVQYEQTVNKIYALASPQVKLTADYSVGGNSRIYSAAEISDMVLALENKPSTKCLRAVEHAKSMLILEHSDEQAEKLFNALLYNIQDSFRYTYPVLERTMKLYTSRRSFYRTKEKFIKDIIDFLGLE